MKTSSYNLKLYTTISHFVLLSCCLNIITAISIGNTELEPNFHSSVPVINSTAQKQTFANDERITMDVYTYAFLNYSYVENNEMHMINYQEEKARYGEGKILTVHGKLIHISDDNEIKNDTACSSNISGTNGRPLPHHGITWIALVRRGHCTFEQKVRNVHSKGAAGVIIYNDKSVLNLEKMQIKGKTRNITAVITYQDIGLAMAMRLDNNIEVMAHIIEGRSGMRPITSFNRTSILFVAISFIILMLISLVWLIVYYIQRFRNLHTKDQQSRHLRSVTQKAIMKIPTKTGKMTDDKDTDSDCCVICIEAYKISDVIRVLPCKHEFHKNCIDPWLIEHRTCPMCKLDVLKFYGYVVGDGLQQQQFQLQQHTVQAQANTASSPSQIINLVETNMPVVDSGILPPSSLLPSSSSSTVSSSTSSLLSSTAIPTVSTPESINYQYQENQPQQQYFHYPYTSNTLQCNNTQQRQLQQVHCKNNESSDNKIDSSISSTNKNNVSSASNYYEPNLYITTSHHSKSSKCIYSTTKCFNAMENRYSKNNNNNECTNNLKLEERVPYNMCSSNSGSNDNSSSIDDSLNNHNPSSSILVNNQSCLVHGISDYKTPLRHNIMVNGTHCSQALNDLCLWNISGLNLTINNNQRLVVESPNSSVNSNVNTNDNNLNTDDRALLQLCMTSNRQVTDV